MREKMNPIRRVFISHTSEFTKYPEKKSFIDAAVAAVNRASCVPCDMGYFTARDEKPAQYCHDRVRECDIYIGVIGLRYGSPVRDRSDLSYTELEFEAASQTPAKTRLVFLLDPASSVPLDLFSDTEHGRRQKEFRKQLSDSGVMCKPFSDVHELEKLIFQALIEGAAGFEGQSPKQERIDWPEGKSPYPGLLAFDEEYAELFFGRDRETDELLAKMSEPDGRVLIISGASGSGKSSLVAAGLRRTLKEGRLPRSEQWAWVRIQPGEGEKPFDSLAWGLKQAFPRIAKRPQDLANEWVANKTALGELLAVHMAQGQELVLFIDQLEELFSRGFKDEDVRNFLEYLVATARDTRGLVRVVATVRSEFIARLEESEAILHILNSDYKRHLGPVSPRILQDMIERPARATGYDFEPELVDDILRDAAQEPGNLPLVAYALKQLFERRRGRVFTRDSYKEIKGVAGAIGTQADQVMDKLDEQARGAFDKVFAELVHLERERPATRKRAPLSVFTTDKAANQLIDALTGQDCRILVRGGEGPKTTVEVAHEKLFTAWPKLKDWIDNGGEALRLIDYAEEASRRWHETGGHLQELWRSERAQTIQNALTRFNKIPSPLLERMLKPQQMLVARLEQGDLSQEDRLLIGKKLGEFGDTRSGVGLRPDGLPDIEWVEIPGGQVKLEHVKRSFIVKGFRVGRYPVTNMQFDAFLNHEDGYRNEQWWKGIQQSDNSVRSSWREANCPRETVSWFEAVAFCRWLSQRTGSRIRLSTEWEWQQAATGGEPLRKYPWSGGWDAARCNSSDSQLNRTTAVGMYPNGATRQGVLDMVGNVWEWCLNSFKFPGGPESVCVDDTSSRRAIRGGSWDNVPEVLRAWLRGGNFAGFRNSNLGFRLVQEIEE
jgi:hypothetical protein